MSAASQPDLSALPEELRERCFQYLCTLGLHGGPAITAVHVVDEFVVIYYTSMQYQQSQEIRHAVGGNCPLFVDVPNNAVYLKGFWTQIPECVQAAREGTLASLLTRII